MTDVTSERKKIQSEEVQFRASVSEATFTKMGGSVNWIIDNSTFMVGDVIPSCLTEPQFQAQRGTDWVLLDGRDVTGSDYQTVTGNSTLPDSQGRYIRGQGGIDPLSTPLLGTQTSSVVDHTHENKIGQGTAVGGSPSFPLINVTGVENITIGSTTSTSALGNVTGGVISGGGVETRPETLVLNYFIKINNSV